MTYSLNTSSSLDTYVKAACKPFEGGLNRLTEIVSGLYFKPGRLRWNPDESVTVHSDYTLSEFSFTEFDLQNDGVIIAVDWYPGAHTYQYSQNDMTLISIRDQSSNDGNTVSLQSDETHGGYTTNFYVSLSDSVVKNTENTTVAQKRQVSYIHYKPGTRVFSLVNDGTEADTYTLPTGAFNIDRVMIGGGRPDDRIFGWVMLHKVGSDFSGAEVTELEDTFGYLFSRNIFFTKQFRVS